jgi:hypothetical protein
MTIQAVHVGNLTQLNIGSEEGFIGITQSNLTICGAELRLGHTVGHQMMVEDCIIIGQLLIKAQGVPRKTVQPMLFSKRADLELNIGVLNAACGKSGIHFSL